MDPTGSYWGHILILSYWVLLCHIVIVVSHLTLRPGSLQDYEGSLWVKPMGSASVTLSLLVDDTVAGTETWPVPKVSQWQLGVEVTNPRVFQEISLIR